MERTKLKIEFDHMGNKHKHTFTPEEEDWWTSFESNGNSYDVHYDEDYGAISVYEYSDKGTDYSNTVYSKKIMGKGGSTYAEGGGVDRIKYRGIIPLRKGDKIKVDHPSYKNLVLTIDSQYGDGYYYISSDDRQRTWANGGWFDQMIRNPKNELVRKPISGSEEIN